ncbi:MAG: Na+/H+ antiporter NhaC family protein [Mailhella sp.]|nr:Na+/H+ antiporter NhaC family protein [Mailhella sp.]
MNTGRLSALLPIGLFIVLYLGLGILYEYVLKVPMGFYNIPIVVAFLAALMAASFQCRGITFDEQLELMAKGMGDRNIMTMSLIFLTAGIFVGVVGRSAADSAAYCILSFLPVQFTVPALFIISAFISLAMGTSCGTITVITPIAVSMATASGFSLPLCLGAVMGGAMFGDNLSFISDTTIASCNTQGCPMQAKFRENIGIALPAALATLVISQMLASGQHAQAAPIPEYSLLRILPYILVLLGGIAGFNVFAVLLAGIASGAAIMLISGATTPTAMLASMGAGTAGMFETSMVAILVAALGALIRHNGGFDAMLRLIRNTFRGCRGGQLGIGLLSGAMDIATANNTVAIVMAGPIARDIAAEYGISPRKAASLLDIFSCVMQGIIPYGAQMLLLIAAAHELGHDVSAMQVIPNLIYPFLLLASALVFIAFSSRVCTMRNS